MSKKLIINADDYGLCPEVNRAIENLIEAGKLKNVSVLANSWFYDEALAFLSVNRHCSVGIHLNVIEGVALSATQKARPLLGKNGEFLNLKQILMRWMTSPFAVSKAIESEWRAQIELLLKDGLIISHADSHQHIHAFAPFWRILTKLCQEFGIPAVRLPRERNVIAARSVPAFALNQSAGISRAVDRKRDLVYNEHLLGFKRAGSYGEDEMICDVRLLKEGVTELVVHPSICDGVPYPNLRGELEFKALSGSKIWHEIEKANVKLLTWAEIKN